MGSILKRIEINPKVMLGKPVIKGTRVTVEVVLKKLAQNISVEDILKKNPRNRVRMHPDHRKMRSYQKNKATFIMLSWYMSNRER